jgi:hypothetical protein
MKNSTLVNPNARSKLEIAGGGVLVALGIIFLIGFGFSLQELVTDSIFIIFGILLIRGAYNKKQVQNASSRNSAVRRSNRPDETHLPRKKAR